jgi:hypothetical protein
MEIKCIKQNEKVTAVASSMLSTERKKERKKERKPHKRFTL